MKLLHRFAVWVVTALAALLKPPPAPRHIKFSCHQFVRRGWAKVWGSRNASPLATRLAIACTIAVVFVVAAAAFSGAVAALSPPGLTLLAAPSAVLVAKRGELDEKRKNLASVFEAAGDNLDFQNKGVLEKLGAKDSAEAVEKVRAANKEIEKLYDEVKALAEIEDIREGVHAIGNEFERAAPRAHADPSRPVAKTIGEVIVESPAFKAYRDSRTPATCEIEGFGLREVRAALFETGAGWAPESVRSGRVVEAATRPLQVIDIIPAGTTDQAAYVYMEETTRTHAAAETAEGGNYNESSFELTERNSQVRKITDSVPVTDEQFEDVPGVMSYLGMRLTFGLRQRYDGQILNGNGTAPNLRGILATAGIQTQALGTDNVPDAIYKGMTKVRVTGRAVPNYALLHPNDWQGVRLMKTADGIYIWGSPSEAGPERIWGLPVVQTDALPENTGLVADVNWCMAFERRGIDVQVGYVGSQFMQGQKTIRADLRVAFAVFRPAAFCTVTGI